MIARGRVPCDVLFIGEAPGESENVIGQPFMGPAGKLLDLIIRRSIPSGTTYAMTNLVACIPRDMENGGKTEEPPMKAIMKCSDRLREFVEIAKPKLIVCVGSLSRNWIMPEDKADLLHGFNIPIVDIIHPSAILHSKNIAMKGLSVQRAEVTIRAALVRVLHNDN